ncbi:hypothetical protein TSOC_006821, partial [Tetrabaena socialis]
DTLGSTVRSLWVQTAGQRSSRTRATPHAVPSLPAAASAVCCSCWRLTTPSTCAPTPRASWLFRSPSLASCLCSP